jgi:hypothetical protein
MKKFIFLFVFLFSFNSFAQQLTAFASYQYNFCSNPISAYLEVVADGGIAPYEFSINDGLTFQTSNQFSGLLVGTNYKVTVRDSNGQSTSLTFIIDSPSYTKMVLSTIIENQTVTCVVTGGRSTFGYSLDGQNVQISNIFTNLPIGTNTIYVFDSAGCYETTTFNITAISQPLPINNIPSGTPQNFTQGQTLAETESIFNLTNGATIKWYATASNRASSRNSNKNTASEIPSSTVMIDGASYFAAKVESGIESTSRYELKVALQPLKNESFSFKNLSTYPNPVTNMLTVNNESIIDSF